MFITNSQYKMLSKSIPNSDSRKYTWKTGKQISGAIFVLCLHFMGFLKALLKQLV